MKKTYRDYEEKEQLIKRLNIISGQIDGIKKMIEEDRYCKDILIQIAAIKNAINSLGNQVLGRHLKTCVERDIKDGKDEIMDEVMDLVKKLQ